jgi:ATP-dependent Clp protease ATP-binding subunit ClpA
LLTRRIPPLLCHQTELCRALAHVLFDTDKCMTRIDMSEYSEQHSVARLIGAPPGYVSGVRRVVGNG